MARRANADMSEGDMEYLYRRKTGRMINALPAVNEVSNTESTSAHYW